MCCLFVVFSGVPEAMLAARGVRPTQLLLTNTGDPSKSQQIIVFHIVRNSLEQMLC